LARKKFDILTPKRRRAMMRKRFSDEEIKRIIEYFKNGASVWEVTEKIYNFKFDHSDRKTWIFYQKVNNIRHKYKLAPIKLDLSMETRIELNKFVQKYGETKLMQLIRSNQK